MGLPPCGVGGLGEEGEVVGIAGDEAPAGPRSPDESGVPCRPGFVGSWDGDWGGVGIAMYSAPVVGE